MTRRCFPLVLAAMAACTNPAGVDDDLVESRALLTAVQADLGTGLAARADRNRQRNEAALIARGAPVVELSGDCETFAARQTRAVYSRCTLADLASRGDEGLVLDFIALLDGYLSGLEALASSQTVEDTRKAAADLVAAFGAPDAQRTPLFEAIAQPVRDRRALIVEGSGFIVDQMRLRALRRVVRHADPIIADGTDIVVRFLEGDLVDPEQPIPTCETATRAVARLPAETPIAITSSQRLVAAQLCLTDREAQLANAYLGTGPQRQARIVVAVQALRDAHGSFVAAQAEATSLRLWRLRQVHAELLDRVSRGATPSEIVQLLEQLRRLRDASLGE